MTWVGHGGINCVGVGDSHTGAYIALGVVGGVRLDGLARDSVVRGAGGARMVVIATPRDVDVYV
jgi:hypothetical protein